MAFSIKTEEADELARELAAATKESLTQAVTVALRERLARVRATANARIGPRLDLLTAEYVVLLMDRDTSADDVIGYDEVGLPR